jgi:hypothetical protein
VIEVLTDPTDRRRTLTRISDAHRRSVATKGNLSVNTALIDALGDPNAVATLEAFAKQLMSPHPGPILKQIRDTTEQE